MIKKEFLTYFEKLNVQPIQLSMELVRELQKNHLAQFSFNNLAVLLGKTISLDISDIIKKIVTDGIGGYCFEHNKLMHDVLKSLGFNVRCLIARVVNNQDIDAPRTHRITLLEWDGDNYLVDVGFGPKCIQAPIKIKEDSELKVKYQTHRIVINQHGDYQLELLTDNGYFSLYTFNLNRYTESDCMVGNFYSNNHPYAVFVNNLVVSLILQDKIISIMNSIYYLTFENSITKIEIKDHIQLQSIIKDDFNIALSVEECITIFEEISG